MLSERTIMLVSSRHCSSSLLLSTLTRRGHAACCADGIARCDHHAQHLSLGSLRECRSCHRTSRTLIVSEIEKHFTRLDAAVAGLKEVQVEAETLSRHPCCVGDSTVVSSSRTRTGTQPGRHRKSAKRCWTHRQPAEKPSWAAAHAPSEPLQDQAQPEHAAGWVDLGSRQINLLPTSLTWHIHTRRTIMATVAISSVM